MTPPGVVLGEALGPFDGRLDAATVQRYAAATNDPSPGARAGDAVPVVAIVTQIWQAQEAGRAAFVTSGVQASASGGVHGEHDIVVHRPIRPGERLRTWVRGHSARPAGRNALVTLHYATYDDGDALLAEQWWTTVYLGATCEASGPEVPGHRHPDASGGRPVGGYDVTIDGQMPRRYAEVSGDWSAHHFDISAAQRSGFERPFLHGLCTMALCAQGVVATVAGGDVERLRRLAVRFAAPAYVGADLRLRVVESGDGGYAFEAHSDGRPVVTRGRAELRD